MSTITEVLSLLTINLTKEVTQPPPNFINFQNSILNIRTLELIRYNRAFRFLSIANVEYDRKAYPGRQLQEFLLQLVGNRTDNLNLLKGSLRPAIDPSEIFQKGFWIYGPAGSGKPTFLSFIRGASPDTYVELSCNRDSRFERFRFKDKYFIAVSEGERLNLDIIRLIKQVTERDLIINERKFEKKRFIQKLCCCFCHLNSRT